MSLSTKESSANSGKLKILFKHMQMDVEMNTDVNFHMDGRNKNIILIIIKCMLAGREIHAQNRTVLIFILIKIKEIRSVHFSNFSLEIEVAHLAGHIMHFISCINQFS